MVDGEVSDKPGLAQSQIDGHAAAAVGIEPQPTPADDASTMAAKMNLERRLRSILAHVDRTRA
jgi:hypothetical protein